MPRGVSIHIGLDTLDESHYKVDGQLLFEPLDGCVKDAILMQEIASSQNFETELFITDTNTLIPGAHTAPNELKAEFIFDRIRSHAKTLGENDIFLITFAGHGSQVTNFNDDPENEGFDQTWCMHNRMVIDDELAQLWSRFAPGVRILFISDSCHGGSSFASIFMETIISHTTWAINGVAHFLGFTSGGSMNTRKDRKLRDGSSGILFNKHQELYENALKPLSDELKAKGIKSFTELIKASIIAISACQDSEIAQDGVNNGAFTGSIKKVWFGNNTPPNIFDGTYSEFFNLISAATTEKSRNQHPVFFPLVDDENLKRFPLIDRNHLEDFRNSKPFRIS